jgi:diguanylate cyclase (GGDEF)-like protein
MRHDITLGAPEGPSAPAVDPGTDDDARINGGSARSSTPHTAPERFRALESSDPARQLRDALAQVDALLRLNAQLSERIGVLRRSLATAAHLALHDELTGLANRRLLLNRFEAALAQGPDPHANVALVYLDLDGFKQVNDQLGHATGDRLLKLVARRLADGIRDSDTACRFGGDEFIVLLVGVAGHEGALAALAGISARLVEPYRVDGHEITIGASVGLAVHPFDGDGFEQLVQVSDRAMGREKTRQERRGRQVRASITAGGRSRTRPGDGQANGAATSMEAGGPVEPSQG